jgi:ATP-dependent 26S proteasome regulatory subunit
VTQQDPPVRAISRPLDAGEGVVREMRRLDALLERAIAAAAERAGGDPAGSDPYRGLYVSQQEAEGLVARAPGGSAVEAAGEVPEREADSPVAMLAALAGLTALDADLLLVALGPDLDLKYERIYAFLQDDVTRRRPAVDLALGLLCGSFAARTAARARLSPAAPLLRLGLLHMVDEGAGRHTPFLSRTLKVDERVVEWLLGLEGVEPAIQHAFRAAAPAKGIADLMLPDDIARRLERLAAERDGRGAGPVIYLTGAAGVGAEPLAAALAAGEGMGLVVVDCARLAVDDAAGTASVVRLVAREAVLRGSAVLLEDWDALLGDERRNARGAVVAELEEWATPTFVSGEDGWDPHDALHRRALLRVEVPAPDHARRARLWAASLNGDGKRTGMDPDALAGRFRFSDGQIRAAAATARNLARTREPGSDAVTMADLYAACRMHSNPRLSALARKVTPRYAWTDIVLPADRTQQLREIASSVKHRPRVYGEWGFDRKLAMGKGVVCLFSGPSGTGKTMAADIIAGELGLDLYKVDLASLVSKYIGETEKNLGRIFDEAGTSNAILFFDEADSMFGKRSEVRDSHDRYANLETSYLLQRVEEYEGVVILATNFRKNIDDAFVRRLHFMIDFPFPGERERLRIWQGVWPRETPRHDSLDLEQVARRVEVAGGSIRNIALAAAFLAADEEGIVTMQHVLRATRREYQKMGKVLSDADLGELARAG